MKPKILVVDDDPVFLGQVSKILENENFVFDTAENGSEALLKLSNSHEKPWSILITDLRMPEMDGIELVNVVKKEYPELVVIVMTVDANVESLIKTLNENRAYSYLVKPVKKDEILTVVEKAFKQYNLLQKAYKFTDNEQELYKHIIETLDWKDEIFSKHVTSIAKEIIQQLNISLSQGQGIGTLLTAISFLFNASDYDEEKESYLVKKDIFKLIEFNYEASVKMMNSISYAQNILMENEIVRTRIAIPEVIKLLEGRIEEMEEMLAIKKQKISLGDFPVNISDKYLTFDEGKMGIVVTELLINAMKYSSEDQNIYIMLFIKADYFEIKFLNPAQKNSDGTIGIDGETERLVFEPFYRMSPVLDERYFKKERFSYGLGLTISKKIIELHGGRIFIYTIKNLSVKDRENDVCVTLRFPIIKED